MNTIDIGDSDYLKQRFLDELGDNIQPRAMREISKFTSLVRAMALINAPFRTIDGKIVVTHKDIDEAAKLWSVICESMTHNLSPQVFDFYKNILLPTWHNKCRNGYPAKGITYGELRTEYYKQTGGYPNMETMRKQWIPMLEITEHIECSRDERDHRRILIAPLVFFDNGDMEK